MLMCHLHVLCPFADLSQTRMPHHNDTQGWELLCFGRHAPAGASTAPAAGPSGQQGAAAGDTAGAGEPDAAGTSSSSVPAEEAATASTNHTQGQSQTHAHAQPDAGTESAPGSAPQGSEEREPGQSSLSQGTSLAGMDHLSGPLLRFVLAMEQVAVGNVLQLHVERLQGQPTLDSLPAQWLFALAARLEKPAHAGVVSSLRALLRKVCVRGSEAIQGQAIQGLLTGSARVPICLQPVLWQCTSWNITLWPCLSGHEDGLVCPVNCCHALC